MTFRKIENARSTENSGFLFLKSVMFGEHNVKIEGDIMEAYRLCYISENKAWFSDNIGKQWGDDWNDRPYEDNAGEPYEEWSELIEDNEEMFKRKYKHHKIGLKTVIYETEYMYEENPCDVGNYSVEEINKGIVPWIKTEDYEIMGGIEYEEFIRVIEEHGGTVYVPRGKDVYERK